MKIILIKDDNKLGKKNTIKEVADSYARNVLIPKGIAVAANAENMNKLNQQLAKEKREYEENVKNAELTSLALNNITALVITRGDKSSEKMFGSVTTKDISEALAKLNINIKKQYITLDMPIKNFGGYYATIKLFGGKSVKLLINVTKGA